LGGEKCVLSVSFRAKLRKPPNKIDKSATTQWAPKEDGMLMQLANKSSHKTA